MNKAIFQKAGLSPTQSAIMEYLFEKKQDKASNIAKNIKKSRAIVYKDLDELAEYKIVEKQDKPNQVSIFKIGHPTHMESFFDEKEKKLKKDRELFNSYLPDMVSAYNLMSNKPGVKYYEGLEGIKTVAKDSLSSKTEILSYLDTENVLKNIEGIANLHVDERLRKKITKKILEPYKDFTIDFLRKNEPIFDENALTQTKLLSKTQFNLNTIMQIYDNKVSYINYSGDSIISIIIEDPFIYALHKELFYHNWNNAKTLRQLSDIQSGYLQD